MTTEQLDALQADWVAKREAARPALEALTACPTNDPNWREVYLTHQEASAPADRAWEAYTAAFGEWYAATKAHWASQPTNYNPF